MRHTGALIASGQEAGSIATREGGRPGKSNGKLLLSDLEIEKIESSRWQRLAGVHPEDWRTCEKEFYGERREPTLTAALRLADNETPENERPWLRVYNIWNFQKCDERFGIQHPGQIPGQIMQNLNWYFTSPGDLVVDLFAGGGSTIDVCKSADDDFGNRKCLAYDIEPRRPDIKKHDMVKAGIPDVSKARLVFLDPPYWAQMKGEYSGHETNLANLDLGTFYDSIVSIANAALVAIPAGAVVALIVGGAEFLGERGRGHDHALEIVSRVRGNLLQRIIVPYSTENYQAHDVTRTKAKKAMLNLYRDLLVWEAQ
jgi:hypothetical protein